MNRVGHISFILILLPAPIIHAQDFPPAIEDNSFLIEEAYNQEDHVVQHISNFVYFPGTRDLLYSFTQEWPVGSMTHQLSYTVPYLSTQINGNGLGDIQINYRYQLAHENPTWGDIAPRVTVIVPTGSRARGLGSGALGVQVSLPISKRISNLLVTHFNAGCTSLVNASGTAPDGSSVKKTLFSYALGGSGILLMQEHFNVLLELLFNKVSVIEGGNVEESSVVILNPGFRFAINVGDLQIVPGLGMPIQNTAGSTKLGIFGYLSFEHPF